MRTQEHSKGIRSASLFAELGPGKMPELLGCASSLLMPQDRDGYIGVGLLAGEGPSLMFLHLSLYLSFLK